MSAAPTTALDPADEARIRLLSDEAQHRGGQVQRRLDGAYFTDDDVALHLARRAIGAALLEAGGVNPDEVASAMSAGADLVCSVIDLASTGDAARTAIVGRLASLRVLDPTCGAGSFLRAAWRVLVEVDDALGGGRLRLDQLAGVDLDLDAVEACRQALRLAAPSARGTASIVHGDALASGALPSVDVILGNPPFVRSPAGDAPDGLATAGVANLSAWIVERALAVARPGARIAFVLPVSTACTDGFAAARHTWEASCDRIHTSHFDTIPASLFDGVVQRLSIFEGRRRDAGGSCDQPAGWYTSRYHRWTREERSGLLERVRHVPLPPQSIGGSIAKVGTATELALLARLFAHRPIGRWFAPSVEGATIHYKRRWSYFLLFTDFVPGIWDADGVPRLPSELKSIHLRRDVDPHLVLAVLSSSLFWWYFSVFTDNRNVNRRDLAAFPVPDPTPSQRHRLAALGAELMEQLHACAEVRTCTYRSIGTIRNTYFRQGATRPVIDAIDTVLGDVYGMDEGELAFVLDHERRFRS